jgi:hypothetical protein
MVGMRSIILGDRGETVSVRRRRFSIPGLPVAASSACPARLVYFGVVSLVIGGCVPSAHDTTDTGCAFELRLAVSDPTDTLRSIFPPRFTSCEDCEVVDLGQRDSSRAVARVSRTLAATITLGLDGTAYVFEAPTLSVLPRQAYGLAATVAAGRNEQLDKLRQAYPHDWVVVLNQGRPQVQSSLDGDSVELLRRDTKAEMRQVVSQLERDCGITVRWLDPGP